MFRRGGSTLRDIVSSALSQSKPFVRKQHILPSSQTLSRNLSKKTSLRCLSQLTLALARKLPTATVTFPRNIFTTRVVRFGETVDSLYFNVLKYCFSVNYNIVDENYSYLSLGRSSKTDPRKGWVAIQAQDIDEVLKAFTYMVHNSSKDESISIRSAAKSYVTYQVVKSSFVVNRKHFRPKTVRYIEITESKPNPSESPYSTCIFEKAWIPVLRNISIMVDRHFSKNEPHTEVAQKNSYNYSMQNKPQTLASPKNAFRDFSQKEPYSKVSQEKDYGNSTRNDPQTSASPENAFRHFSKNGLSFISGNKTLNIGEIVDAFKFPVLNKKYFIGYQEINKYRKVLNICEVSENGKNTSVLIEKDDVEEILEALKYMAQAWPKKPLITINSVSDSTKTYQVMRTSFGNKIKRNCIVMKQSHQGGTVDVTLYEPGWNQAIAAISTLFDKHITKSEPISEWF